MTIFDHVKKTLAAVTDGLASVGERTAAVNLMIGPVNATVYPWSPQPPAAPPPPTTCPTCGAKR